VAKVINCECGYIVEGRDDDELITNAELHMQQDHPEMAGKVTREDLLEMAEEA
jgi:predicted small metal-binding protein